MLWTFFKEQRRMSAADVQRTRVGQGGEAFAQEGLDRRHRVETEQAFLGIVQQLAQVDDRGQRRRCGGTA